ncbi:MAG: hypothetical protein ACFFBD_08450 [Candidatus Hodarchaeota archaeon]
MPKGIDELQQVNKQIQQLQSNLDNLLNLARQAEDELRSQMSQLDQEIKTIEEETTNTEVQIRELSNQLSGLQNDSKTRLERDKSLLERTEKDLTALKTEIDGLRKNHEDLIFQIGESGNAVGSATAQRENLVRQLSNLQAEFRKKQGLESTDITSVDILKTYMALYEKVYAKSPHVRALGLLHGPKSDWNQVELAKTLAASEMVITECIEDLVRAELIAWDEKRESVRLLTRLF